MMGSSGDRVCLGLIAGSALTKLLKDRRIEGETRRDRMHNRTAATANMTVLLNSGGREAL